jgi:hypothetical protein
MLISLYGREMHFLTGDLFCHRVVMAQSKVHGETYIATANDNELPDIKTKARKLKLHYSNYELLANLNNKKDLSEAEYSSIRRRLAIALHKVFNDRAQECLEWKTPEGQWVPMDDHIYDTLVDDILCDITVEMGHRDKKIHAHIMWYVNHRTFLRLAFQHTRDMIDAEFGEPIAHLRYKIQGAANMVKRQVTPNYLMKDVAFDAKPITSADY